MALDHAGESAALAGAGDIHELLIVENIHQNFVANFVAVFFGRCFLPFGFSCASGSDFHCHFAQHTHGRQIVLAKMPFHGLGQARLLHKFHQADLRRLVTIFGGGLALGDDARAGLQHGDRAHVALIVE